MNITLESFYFYLYLQGMYHSPTKLTQDQYNKKLKSTSLLHYDSMLGENTKVKYLFKGRKKANFCTFIFIKYL
jgi:hypothetical protein